MQLLKHRLVPCRPTAPTKYMLVKNAGMLECWNAGRSLLRLRFLFSIIPPFHYSSLWATPASGSLRRALLAGCCLAAAALGAAPTPNFFAGRERLLLQEIPDVAAGQQVWFSIARAGRTLASGSVAATADGHVTLPVALPEMKPGVALALDLYLRLGSDQGAPIIANTPVWLFSEYPYPEGHNPVAPRQIHLYDPAGTTAAAFESIRLPFKTISQLRTFEELRHVPIVIAEGLDLSAERGLVETLAAAAARGCDLLLLAPSAGTFAPPPGWDYLAAGTTQRILRRAPGKEQRYRLDLAACPAGAPHGTRFQLDASEGVAVLATAPREGAEAVVWELPTAGGRLRLCGNAIIARWQATPAARWLLAELLSDFAITPQSTTQEKNHEKQ